MKRKYKSCYHPYVILFFITMGCCYLFCIRNGIFGAKVDWISQHSVLPDYFRHQFYDTGKLFPEFALNIGAGQNIYNFSYYGLYSPLILLSYLLPFVKMSDYMMAVQFLCLIASVLLMYRWISNQKYSFKICMGISMIFLFAGPMIYHSYNQIMFVNYMPFLCMAFLGVDRYFAYPEKKRRIWLILSLFLMIMTSFYFSIGGMLALMLYGVFRYLKMCDEYKISIRIGSFIKEGVMFAGCFFISIMMSAILLVPTAMALTGRGSSTMTISASQVFLPVLSLKRFLYNPYGIGLTAFSMSALAALLFFSKKYEKILAIGCLLILTIPLFAYILNGGLYIRDKVMIPFLPLICYIMAYYLNRMEQQRNEKISLFYGILPYIFVVICILLKREETEISQYWVLLLSDALIMLICWLIFYNKRNLFLLLIPPILFLFGFGFIMNVQLNQFTDPQFYENITDESIRELITETVQKEHGFYRTEQIGNREENAANLNRIWSMEQYISSIYSSSYNQDYQSFRKNIFYVEQPFRNFLMQSVVKNPVFQKFMGIKYKIINRRVEIDENVSPMIYATDQLLSNQEYQKLKFPFNQLVLMQRAVIAGQEDEENQYHPIHLEKFNGNLPSMIELEKEEDYLITLPEKSSEKERILFAAFQVDNLCPSKDVSVWIGDSKNKISAKNHFYYNDNTVFHYAVFIPKGENELTVTLGKGNYKISKAEYYVADFSEVEKMQKDLYQSEFIPDKQRTKDNVIIGDVVVQTEGYLITTIPYDKNFEIQIDGKKTSIKKVNMAFIGCKIEAGKHKVKIIYHAPGVNQGKAISAAGILLFLGIIIQEKILRKRS